MWKAKQIEWIDIELTSFCNISCQGCFRVISKYADDINNKQVLSYDLIKKRFQKEDFPNIKIINFCGSVDEPTTHPEFFAILEYFKEWNCHINIATNGSTKTDQWWARVGDLLKDTSHAVTWGIDGADSTSELYRVGSNFLKVQKNFRAFIKAGGCAIWQFIVFEHNEHQHEDAKQKATAEGFSSFKTIYSHRKVGPKAVENKIEETPYIDCKYLAQQRIFVNHMGNVIPCCHLNSETLEWAAGRNNLTSYGDMLNDEGGKLAINLEYNTLEEIVEGDVFNNIVDSWKDFSIPKCYQTCKKKKHDKFIKERL